MQAEESRENLVFYFLHFKGASPSQRGHLKAQWCLTLLCAFSLEFLSPLSLVDTRVLINAADSQTSL